MFLIRNIIKHRFLQIFAVICLSLISLAFTTNTYAASNHFASHSAKDAIGPHAVYCDAEWVYNDITRFGDQFIPVTPLLSNHNGTGSTQYATFSATASATVSLAVAAGVKVSVNAVVIGVEASFGVTVTTSLTTTLGHAETYSIPPYKTLYAQYGVYRMHTVGHYYWINNACQVKNDAGYIDVYTPYRIGWDTWWG